MKTKTFIILLGVLSFCLTSSAQNAEELIAQGDQLFNEMKDMATAREGLAIYQKALNIAQEKYEIFWRIARIQYFIGVHTEEKKEQKNIFSQGVYWSQKAIDANPGKPDGYYWHGVNNGKYGETRGVLKSLFLVKPIKQDMNKVLELDHSYEDGGADRVLGRVYFKLPGFAGGSKEKSLEHLTKSKELGPEDPLTILYLAETLLELDQVEKAREELEYLLNLPDDDRWVVGIAGCKEEGKKMLQDKKFKKK